MQEMVELIHKLIDYNHNLHNQLDSCKDQIRDLQKNVETWARVSNRWRTKYEELRKESIHGHDPESEVHTNPSGD